MTRKKTSRQDILALPEMKADFAIHYPGYQPSADTIEQLKLWKGNTQVTIVLGTWCSDSRLQLSHFYKILDDAKIDEQWVKLICVDESKRDENGLTDQLHISRVPTFIFTKEGHESGRIIESPELSLEEDILNLFKKQANASSIRTRMVSSNATRI